MADGVWLEIYGAMRVGFGIVMFLFWSIILTSTKGFDYLQYVCSDLKWYFALKGSICWMFFLSLVMGVSEICAIIHFDWVVG